MWRRGRVRKKTTTQGGHRPQQVTGTRDHPSLPETHANLASLIRLQTPPGSLTCQARGPAARTYPRRPHPARDRKVRTHLAGTPSPGSAGAHPARHSETSRRWTAAEPALASRTVPGRPAARSHPPRAPLTCARLRAVRRPAARSSSARSLMRGAPPRRAHYAPPRARSLMRGAPPRRAPSSRASAPETRTAPAPGI